MRAARHLGLRQKESSLGVSPTRRLWSRQFKTHGCLRHGKTRLPSPHRSAGQSTCFGEQHVTPCYRHAPSAIAGSSTSAAAVAALTRSSTVNMNVSSIHVRTLTQVIVGHLGGPLSRSFCDLNAFPSTTVLCRAGRYSLSLADVKTKSLHRGRRRETMRCDTPVPGGSRERVGLPWKGNQQWSSKTAVVPTSIEF